MKNNLKNKGFTLIEVIIASSLMIGMLSMITGFFYSMSKAANYKASKMDLYSYLRPVVERMDKELSPSVNIVWNASNIKLNGVSDFGNGSGASRVLVETLAYDTKGNPMFENNGMFKKDRIGIKAVDIDPGRSIVYRGNTPYNLKKLTISIEPAAPHPGPDGNIGTSDDIVSSRKAINDSLLFNFLMPFNTSTGEYILPVNNTEYQSGLKLFTFYNSSKNSIDPSTFNSTNYKDVTSVKLNLLGEKIYQSLNITARQEAEIIFRNVQ